MTLPIQGQQFDPDEQKLLDDTAEHWRNVWNEMPVQALARVEDAAKQLIAVTAGLQGFYVAVFAWSTIRAQIRATLGGMGGWLILVLFLAPLACWLVSLFYATRVFIPRVQPEVNFTEVSLGAWQKIRDAYRRTSEERLHWLHRSYRWLIISFLFALVAVVALLFLPPVPA